MDYVIRVMDFNGKLRKERFTLASVRVLDKKEILKKMFSQNFFYSLPNKVDGKYVARKCFDENLTEVNLEQQLCLSETNRF